jgi:hypothetical protein
MIELDHFIVSARDKVAAAKLLGELLGVPWAPSGIGPFAPVYINEGLTLDFIDTDEAFPVEHFCFRVSDMEFDAILARIEKAGIAYRSPRATSGRCSRSATPANRGNLAFRVGPSYVFEASSFTPRFGPKFWP